MTVINNRIIRNIIHYGEPGYEVLDDRLEVVPCGFFGRVKSQLLQRFENERIAKLALNLIAKSPQSIAIPTFFDVFEKIRLIHPESLTSEAAKRLESHYLEFPAKALLVKNQIKAFHEMTHKGGVAEIKETCIDAAKGQIALAERYSEADIIQALDVEQPVDVRGFKIYMLLRQYLPDSTLSDDTFLADYSFRSLVLGKLEMLTNREGEYSREILFLVLKLLEQDWERNLELLTPILEKLDETSLDKNWVRKYYQILLECSDDSIILGRCMEVNPKFVEFNQLRKLRFPDDEDREIVISIAELRCMGGFFQVLVENLPHYAQTETSNLCHISVDEFDVMSLFYLSKEAVDFNDPCTFLSMYRLADSYQLPELRRACEPFQPFKTNDEAVAFVEKYRAPRLILKNGKRAEIERIMALHSLEKLVLDAPCITDDSVAGISNLSKLTTLNLTLGAQVSGSGVARLGKLTQLKELRLNRVKHSFDSQFLEHLTQLRLLDLSDAKLNDEAVATIGKLKNLEVLDLARNSKITNAKIFDLTGLVHLKTLNLSKCTGIMGSIFLRHKFTKLTWLNLEGCFQVTHGWIMDLGTLVSLKYLNLSDCCNITARDLSELYPLSELEELVLRSCDFITIAGIERLKKHMPRVWVHI